MTALEIVQDAYARLNRLSPGETLGNDEAAFGFTRLNILVDELSADNLFLYQDVNTSASVTSTITLGAGSWITIPVGTEIAAAQVVVASGNIPLTRIDYAQYREQVLLPTLTSTYPETWAYDGLATVYFYPVPTALTIQLQTRVGVAAFADQTTAYTVPPGYKSLLGAELAVRLAPPVLGTVPPALEKAAKACRTLVSKYMPAIVDNYTYTRPSYRESILNGP